MRYKKLAIFLIAVLAGCAPLRPPETPQLPVTIEYHGVEVNDPYLWLEDWGNPQVQTWSKRQNAYARHFLYNLPYVRQLRKRISEILSAQSVSYSALSWRKEMLFALKRQPPMEQPILITMPSAEQPQVERVIVDLNKIDPSGNTSIDFYVPSPDGRLIAASLSVGGSESGDVHIFETASGRELPEIIRRVNGGTAGGDVAWISDDFGFYYTRYPHEGEHPAEDMNFYQQVWFHKIGSNPDEDRYELGRDFPRIAEIKLETNISSGSILATVQYGDSGRFAYYIHAPQGQWKKIIDYDEQIVQAMFGKEGELFLISRADAPRGKILRLSLDNPSLENSETIIHQSNDTIVNDFYYDPPIVATENRLYVTYQLGGPSEIRVFDYNGMQLPGPQVLPVSSVGQIVALDKNRILYSNASYINPPAWYRYNPETGMTDKTALEYKSPVDFSDCEVVRQYATSKDGTKIPINIIRRKGTVLDGTNPVLLTGYGGYGISMVPRFRPLNHVWIEQGGVYAQANLRGGGEFGEKWHEEGMLTKKQNVFDDFAAAMQYMIDAGYTSPDKLAILGGSNGGLLMGAMIIQHPQLCRVVVSFVGLYDMLRSELSPNGEFNIPEFGTIKNPEQFRAMYAYSPYHNIKQGTEYPAVLFLTGANDPRVDPMHSRKMTARLQAATSSSQPILLRTSSKTGHGIGNPLSEQIAESVDYYAFLMYELDMNYQQPKSW